jgi:hypothetical protein
MSLDNLGKNEDKLHKLCIKMINLQIKDSTVSIIHIICPDLCVSKLEYEKDLQKYYPFRP